MFCRTGAYLPARSGRASCAINTVSSLISLGILYVRVRTGDTPEEAVTEDDVAGVVVLAASLALAAAALT